jgi:hypothetical protein
VAIVGDPVMRLLFVLSLLCSIALVRAAERDERHVFPVQPGCTLKLDSYRGSVIVTESDEPVVRVSIHMEIGSDTEAEGDRMRAGLQLDVKAADNTVTIFARNPKETRARWVWQEDKQIDLTYRITVPRRCNVDVKVINGNVAIGNLDGRLAAWVENGDISFRQVGGQVEAAVERGNITVSRCVGALTARVLQGVIRTGSIGGAADLKNASGNVEILQAHGPVKAIAEAGDVIVGFPRRIGGEVELTSRGGNVLAKIDPRAAGRIVATSVWGEVHCKLPVTVESGTNGRSRLTAQLNEGGPVLTLRASGGNVRVERGETLFE